MSDIIKYFDFEDIRALIKGIFMNEVKRFEKEFSEYLGCRYAIGTSYGRTALYVGLKALNLPNKEIILPCFTCNVVRQAVLNANVIPVFVDINYDDFTFDEEDLEKKITPNTKAILLTHFFGEVARNTKYIKQFAKNNGLYLIEDCAHSLGAEYQNKKIGTHGIFSIFSLTKNTVNLGGGVIATNNKELYAEIKKIIDGENLTLKNQIGNYVLIIAYGLEQIIKKIIFDRFKKSLFKWWVIFIPLTIRSAKRNLRHMVQGLKNIKNRNTQQDKGKEIRSEQKANITKKNEKYKQVLEMNSIIASIGRTQLRKLDELNFNRRIISRSFENFNWLHRNNDKKDECKDVHTHLVFNYENENIKDIAEIYRKNDILLNTTWPARQRMWDEQKTPNTTYVKNNILIWNVSPMVNAKEIDKFKNTKL